MNNKTSGIVAYFFFLFMLFVLHGVNGQELPPIVNYSSTVYAGGSQNWAISQEENKFIYVANNDGLLEFNGANWTLYPSPNKAIMRSTLAIEGKVYSGSYMDFGYWQRNEFGTLKYSSLSQKLGLDLKEGEQFWNILPYNEWILFQSLNRIYIYNSVDSSIRFIESKGTLNKSFKVGDKVFFHVLNDGLYTIEKGESVLVSEASIFKNDIVIDVLEIDNQMYVVTQSGEFYSLSGSETTKWRIPADALLQNTTIYNSEQLKNGNIAIGTISSGIFLISRQGEVIFQINQTKGLGNNTVLSLFEDYEGNIWAGLDNGIDCINVTAPFSNYVDQAGRLGTTYASVLYQGNLYLGTNQGLFYKSTDSQKDFELVEGTNGQVWCLNVIDDTLFCGHNAGTYIIDNGSAKQIAWEGGTWGIKRINDDPNTIIQGNYSGLHILKKEQGTWRIVNKLNGFDISSKHFEISENGKILVSHEYKGVYILDINAALTKVVEYKRSEKFNTGANSSLVSYDGAIYYACVEGLFKYVDGSNSFIKEDNLSDIFTPESYVSGKLIAQDDGKLWAFSKDFVHFVSKEDFSAGYKMNQIPIPQSLRKGMTGYENISHIKDDTYLIGTSNGYLLVDISALEIREYEIYFNQVSNGNKKGNMKLVSNTAAGKFKSSENYLKFAYSVPEFSKYQIAEYQYQLAGASVANWSEWSTNSSISFENLKYGDYNFQVKARVNKKDLSSVASYNFTIHRPWYASNTAMIAYGLLFVVFFILLNWFYKRYYRKQRERLLEKSVRESELKDLEAQREIMQLRNESLNQDIEARNRELAISTMSMIKQNNALSKIKEELISLNDDKTLKPVVGLINNTMNDASDWKFFEEAFNHADKDFFKKVKELHPELTPNDLRLCVYLRLNLSSKEIAPLLNISSRSVEIKRYRLRKKIQLDRDVNLNDYFIKL